MSDLGTIMATQSIYSAGSDDGEGDDGGDGG